VAWTIACDTFGTPVVLPVVDGTPACAAPEWAVCREAGPLASVR
jgi:hypothetical protein